MAKLDVTVDLLSNLLFGPELASITDVVAFDKNAGIITFEIEGGIVPEISRVTVEIQEHYRTIKFTPVVES